MSKQSDEDWLKGVTDDTAKVDYLKARVAAEAATEQKRIEELEETRRANIQTDGYHIVRGFWVMAVLAAIGMGTCLGYKHIDSKKTIELERIQAEHPRPAAPPATLPAAASAAPAASK